MCCLFLATTISAQKTFQKAENYAKMNAPFLSIKYLHKHISKKKKDRKAMRLLANSYFQVNMIEEGQKWMLKANDSPSATAYFNRRNEKKRQERMENNSSINKKYDQFNSNTFELEKGQDCLMLVVAVSVMGLL